MIKIKLPDMLQKTYMKIQIALGATLALLISSSQKAFAQITNPALEAGFGGAAADAANAADGSIFATYFIMIWQFIISVGGLMVVLYFIWGAVDWIVAGGDQSKIQKGRDRMIQAVIGMVLLAGSFVIISLINTIFFQNTFDILNIQF
jgi:hypothetical protein